MFLNNELKIMVPGYRVIAAEVREDGSCLLKLEQVTVEVIPRHSQEDVFRLVRASKLSLRDDFLRYIPKTPNEKDFKEAVEKAIEDGLQDFYLPTIAPSFDDDDGICYQAGMKPAVGKSYDWWREHAKAYCPERKSRLGTYSEYIAFLAVFIKEAPIYGKTIEWAWNAVCNDSKELGHYYDSNDAKHDLEATGNRTVCGWSDLANTYMILANDKEAGGFWMAGGSYFFDGSDYPLADMSLNGNRDVDIDYGTGWLVLS